MAFCSTSSQGITLTNYNTAYPATETSPTCLDNNGAGFSVPDQMDGTTLIVKPASLTAHVTSLLSRSQATAPAMLNPDNLDPATTFQTKSAALRASIEKEYCYYYNRYMFILRSVLNDAASTTTLVEPALSAYNTKKTNARALNSKLNQILQILQELEDSRTKSLSNYYSSTTGGVNQLNGALESMRTDLMSHSKQLESKTLETDIQSAMIDYTMEKNSSSRNLLAVYGFMNIVAIGMLFYLYRSAKA